MVFRLYLREKEKLTKNEIMEDLKNQSEKLNSLRYDYYELLGIEKYVEINSESLFESIGETLHYLESFFQEIGKKLEITSFEEKKFFILLQNNSIFYYSEAFCVLSHPELKGVYDKFLKKGEEKKFVEFIGSQFEFFFRELEKDFNDSFLFFHEKENYQGLQNKVSKTIVFFEDEKKIKSKVLKMKFLSLFEEELENTIAFLKKDVKTLQFLDEYLSGFTLAQRRKIIDVFQKHSELIFFFKSLKGEEEVDNIIGIGVFDQLRFFKFKIDFYEKIVLEKEEHPFYIFFQELFLCRGLKGNIDEKISSFSEILDSIFLKVDKGCVGSKKIEYTLISFFYQFDELKRGNPARDFYEKFLFLEKGENFFELRNNYLKFLFLDVGEKNSELVKECFFLEENHQSELVKESCRIIKKSRQIGVKNKERKELVRGRGCTFPIQEALDCLEEACCVFSCPILGKIFFRLFKEGKQKDFVELVSFFRKEIEEKNKVTENKHIFISDQSQDGLKKNVLEVAEKLDDFSENERIDKSRTREKKLFLNFFEKALILLEEDIERIFYREFSKNCVENGDFIDDIRTLSSSLHLDFSFLSYSSLSSCFSLKWVFYSHLRIISRFRFLIGKDNETNISGKEEFFRLWNFRKKVLNEPLNILFQFGKKLKEVIEREGFSDETVELAFIVFVEKSIESEFYKANLGIVNADSLYYENGDSSFLFFLQTLEKQTQINEKQIISDRINEEGSKIGEIKEEKKHHSFRSAFFLKRVAIGGFFLFLIIGIFFVIYFCRKKEKNKNF